MQARSTAPGLFLLPPTRTMPIQGDVYYLPAAPDELRHKGDRPHVLVSLGGPDDDMATFAYGSTQPTDAARGAAHVIIEPETDARRGTGLRQRTYVYLSRLVSYMVEDLPAPSGRIVHQLPALRRALRQALGIGTAVPQAAEVRRGRVAEYRPHVAEQLGARFAVVVTEPGYSRASPLQTTIPLLDPREYPPRPGDLPLEPAGGVLSGLLGLHGGLLAAVPLIQTVYAPLDLVRYTGLVIPADVMRLVDAALVQRFGLDT